MVGFTFNGVHSGDFGLKIKEVEKGILPSLSDKTQDIRHGSYFYQTRVEPREISITCFVDSINLYAFQEQLREISFWLYTEEPQKLILDEEDSLFYYAKLTGSSIVDQELWFGEVTLNFICYDPFAYDLNKVVLKDTYSIDYTGTAEAFPLIEFTSVHYSSITLGGYKLEFDGLEHGQHIIVNTNKGKITNDMGENLLKALTFDSVFPRLKRGRNLIQTNVKDLVITYHNRYV